MARKKRADYEIGYRKPSVHTRFQLGRSGNPKGRPKGRKNLATITREFLARPVLVKQNGQELRMSFAEAFVHKLMARCLDGTARDMIAIMKAISEYVSEVLVADEQPMVMEIVFVEPDGKVQTRPD